MLNNLKIGLRLGLGLAIMFLLLASVILFGINRMNLLSEQTTLIYNHPLTVSNAVLRINADIIKIHRAMKDIALAQDIDSIDEYSIIVDLHERNIMNDFGIISERFLGEKHKYQIALETFEKWKPIRDEVITLMLDGKRSEAANITRGVGARHVVKIEKTMEALGDFAQSKAKDFLLAAEKTKASAFSMMYFLVGISVFIAAIFAVFITRSFTAPIGVLKSAAEKIGRGNLDTEIGIDSKDEIGQLAESIRNMTTDLKIITTSRDNLTLEIVQRRKAEEAIKESEEKYRILFERESDAIFIYDPDTTNILDANEATFKMYGYDRDEVIGMSCLNFSAEIEKSSAALEKIRENNNVNITCRLHRKKDGTVFPVDISGYSITLNGKNVMYAVSRDITERKQLEEERQKIVKLESIGILAGGIAHDFNNLLAVMRNNIYLSKMIIDRDSELYENMESTEKVIYRASNLTQQLLTFAKGGMPVKNTSSIIDLIKESTGFALRGSNVNCEYNVSDDLWPVEVDEGQMNQVIHNLVLNAAQAMPNGGTIQTSLENFILDSDIGLPLQGGAYVKITVKDQGVGIKEDQIMNIFDPYFTTKETGHGLGLSITYSIIRNHNGHITVESETGVGTTFTIYLPASEKHIDMNDLEEEVFIAGEGKVLIMDDEEVIRESVKKLLINRGYEVECVNEGNEATALYKKAMEASRPFDAVILDLTIRGGMGGKETIKKLREINPNVKAIVSSGYSNDPVMANYREYGFCGLFAKHHKVTELGKTLHNIIKDS